MRGKHVHILGDSVVSCQRYAAYLYQVLVVYVFTYMHFALRAAVRLILPVDMHTSTPVLLLLPGITTTSMPLKAAASGKVQCVHLTLIVGPSTYVHSSTLKSQGEARNRSHRNTRFPVVMWTRVDALFKKEHTITTTLESTHHRNIVFIGS